MTQDELKQKTAEYALRYIKNVAVVGIGTGSTVNHFINFLADMKGSIDGTVSSSIGTTKLLKKSGLPVLDLNEVGEVEIYIDGADEVNPNKQLIKGGGGALTREKIITAATKTFVCIADETKLVNVMGKFPLPIEVLPMARSYVAREIVKLGGQPVWRESCLTDNGNHIIDVHNLEILNPSELERTINNITGVVTNGLFAMKPADIVLIGKQDGIETM